jgi:hypothetical protein
VELFRTGSGDSIAAELQMVLGIVVGTRGELERETELLEESLTLSQEASSLRGMAASLFTLGVSWKIRGDFKSATQLLEEALTMFRQTGEQALIASVLPHLWFTFVLQGDLERTTTASSAGASVDAGAVGLSRGSRPSSSARRRRGGLQRKAVAGH